MKNKLGLIILDGWGIGDGSKNDAISQANTPYMDYLLNKYPNATLNTSGEDVGLPNGQMGNSEVGHLNIGAGRIVYQELTRINKSIDSGSFFENKNLIKAINLASQNNRTLHLMGLVSDGGVHSSIDHLIALCRFAKTKNLKKVAIHAFTDGRDCDPKSGLKFILKLENEIKHGPCKIASIIGRYYAMDRDQRWERIKKAHALLTEGQGSEYESATEAIQDSYKTGVTDEFIEPCIIKTFNNEASVIQNDDVVICFNFRTDRPREITESLTQKSFPDQEMMPLKLNYFTFTNYNIDFKNIHVLFEKDNLKNTLGEVLSNNNKNQVRIAETEKYPHVTFFFNGGQEAAFNKEKRILVNSPKVATYDLQPEMSANEVKIKITKEIEVNSPDFFCLNFANPDMVGHTGVFKAITEAVECVDECLKRIVELGKKTGYEFIIIADHGNADFAINQDGSPHTAHTLNPVPVVFVSDKKATIKKGILADIAPSILIRLGISIPEEMTGENIISIL